MTYKILEIPTYNDTRGSLSVIDNLSNYLNFDIKRVYYIYNNFNNLPRGGHRHKSTCQALICINGSCNIQINDGIDFDELVLDKPNKCLILEPKDWHTMSNFTKNCILVVFASELYDYEDYIFENY